MEDEYGYKEEKKDEKKDWFEVLLDYVQKQKERDVKKAKEVV